MIAEFRSIFERDIEKLKTEIESFQSEANLWVTKGAITNTSGNLCLHLVGNLKAFVGNNMGGIKYTRDRKAEFSLKDIPRATLVQMVNETKEVVLQTFETLTSEDLEKKHPQNVLGYEMTNRFFLIHLASHLSYHLGQINYLRRMLE
ncbi:DUF1572 domain-containing protein [Marinoscillum sp. MHG1-6]|uniref:DUF1572 domain-containing protein n=1 Tax=Marinoscillum sp. MHG1-6 TaxID=2959627 RepID=UPI0021578801|nr:DUF1572 domain-containing protein [Marinoscillum sp. MHG1-6]